MLPKIILRYKKYQLSIVCTLLICCVYLLYTTNHVNSLNPNIERLVFDINHRNILNKDPVNDFKKKDMYLINPSENVCKDCSCDSLQMLFVVKSYVLNFGQREAIRRTWGGKTQLRSKTVFIIGYLDDIKYFVDLESAKHKDIVQLNVYDQYQNVVYKTIYALLWLSKMNITSTFIHFVDDDRFVNPVNIYDVAMNNIRSTELVMMGYMIIRSKTVRNKSWKTYVSPEDYPFDFYPPYIIGGTILTNTKTVRMLAIAVAYIKVIPIEDAYIGIVANSININMKHNAAFLAYTQSLSTLLKAVSSPGYETTYILLRDWNWFQMNYHTIEIKNTNFKKKISG
ncbi:beta-1,3-galactosyltransferase brn-like isoform X1 [Mytilus californianus]|uniref:beta-1,3-galactosyltransferase brn-like isoform X1 n=1 Tax=Mytilus californianus TaxID=6549 RepID=UPI0022463155|nr:beta-1,3-galactosyltransferase brn-like isoform X1 [Mytilus californianus]